MKIAREILYGVSITEVIGSTAFEIEKIVFDSRQATKGTLFVAIVGVTSDGHDYISQAIKQGCTAIICEKKVEEIAGVNYIIVNNSHKALGIIASNFYDSPSTELKLVGITGTNGKTTTVTLLHDLFMGLGYKTGLLSTVVNKIGNESIPSTHTTPNPVELNSLLRDMVDAGCDYCFMEVSSHAIHQHRIAGLKFAGGVFTNITHDHLDYHKTLKEYIQAKKAFFDELPSDAFALTNNDDKNGLVMVQNTKAKISTYGLKSISDFKLKVLENQFSGLLISIDKIEMWSKLIGDFNAYNLLVVYAVATLLGQEQDVVLTEMSKLESVEGRFQYDISKTGIIAIVDYAHTPDALENVLKTIESIRTKNETLYTIIGCGGDRDKTKRPEMAKIACEYSDKVILTSDNPRSEEPEAILQDMQKGVGGEHFRKTTTISDRKEAIKMAVSTAQKGDIILVAGKGHEKYQEIKGVKHDFDDKVVIHELLKIFEK
ncbi:MAG: UDP-N-acetylmuramoyl-L-alanyl-D-glutamate--2,6-diaminopimelate ligase [Crocinitomicaceae bacterium]